MSTSKNSHRGNRLVVLGLALCTLAGSAEAQDDEPAEVATDEAQGTKTEAQDRVGQPATQIFAAVNIQFITGKH